MSLYLFYGSALPTKLLNDILSQIFRDKTISLCTAPIMDIKIIYSEVILVEKYVNFQFEPTNQVLKVYKHTDEMTKCANIIYSKISPPIHAF